MPAIESLRNSYQLPEEDNRSNSPLKRISNSVEPGKKHSNVTVSQTSMKKVEFPSFNPKISLNSSLMNNSTATYTGKYLSFTPFTKFGLNDTNQDKITSINFLNTSIGSSGDEPKIIQNQGEALYTYKFNT